MDDIVKAAMAKWPNVPDCYGWLALDARGDWYMRDDRIQASGPFPEVKGSRVNHDKLKAFIERNLSHDDRGAWFFQNGPQRVYLQLEAAPWVLRVRRATELGEGRHVVDTHTGLRVHTVRSAWLDELGRLFLDTEHGLGIVHSLDMDAAADLVEAGTWVPEDAPFSALPERFGYLLQPAPLTQRP
ncbi:DUF2946 family protein [Aquabacterium sp.]|uniref:DUF2946 family protein n=1 Tax=Aquabacterium sp. TaxID=1872578 RepID=UPI0025BB9D7B|nr:DUF2946 family protein [Aquabacterium sp.]